jgi:exopolyphosphatase/pppGpp-phosphohydrolase
VASPAQVRAAIDVGSNSIHLLVAGVTDGELTSLADESIQLGLGDVVDREGHIPDTTRNAVLDALELYAQRARALGSDSLILLATEPFRRASNRSAVADEVLRVIGQPVFVLSHSAEAELTFLGATGGQRPDEPLLVVDVGGGSTETLAAAPGRDPVIGWLPIGSARLTAAFVASDPPTWFEINAMRAEAVRLVASLPEVDLDLVLERAVGVGGSATNLPRINGGARLAGAGIDRPGIERALSILARSPTDTIAAEYGVSARRAQQLAGGAALLDAILARYGVATLDVSDASLREGAILAAIRGGEGWLERLPQMLR